MRKLAMGMMIAATSMALLTGCSSTKNNSVQGESVQTTTDASKEDMVTITHSRGVTEVAKHPKKVVVFELSILDTMEALGIEAEFGLPSGLPASMDSYEDATVVGSMKEIDMEAIYMFEPDVIFISGRVADYYDELNKIAPTVFVDLAAETYVEDVIHNATYVAELFDETEQAKEIIASIEERVTRANELTSASDEKALILLTNEGSMSVYGSGSRYGFIHDVLGVTPADEGIAVSTHGQEASYEYIATINPDIIYVIDRSTAVGGTVFASDTLNNDLVNETKAAKQGKIISLDAETWYLIGGGLNAIQSMMDEVIAAFE